MSVEALASETFKGTHVAVVSETESSKGTTVQVGTSTLSVHGVVHLRKRLLRRHTTRVYYTEMAFGDIGGFVGVTLML